MRIDTSLPKDISNTAAIAAELEASGYDGIWTGETKHDPFLQMLQAAEATERITVGTSIAIAFARSPMTLASAGYDLAQYAEGRFVLGLGSQVKAHIERRFSMPWSHPARRMRELILAMRAIWATWQDGSPLDFDGEFYRHTLMTPFFTPEAHEWGPPPVYLAAVGTQMTEVAGEVADGYFFHPFTTEEYLRTVTLPALERGRARSARPDGSFSLAGPAFTCVGRTEEELATAIAGTKAQIAFYGSTPSYRGVLELHGYGDLQPELTRLSKEGRWADMGAAIDDELLNLMAVVGTPDVVAAGLHQRWGSVAQRVSLYATYETDDSLWPELLDALARHRPS